MTTTIAPPTARTDWTAVTLGGLLAAGLVWWAFAWPLYWLWLGGFQPRYMPQPMTLGQFWAFIFKIRNEFMMISSWAEKVAVFLPLLAGAVAGLAVALKLSTPRRTEIHHEGGRLLVGAPAAKAALAGEAARSPVDIELAGVPITRDRFRRSITCLGSPGGGKTQILWNIILSAGRAGYRMLVVDGPKGDYSTQMPGRPLIIAPWHQGLAWDIARDCPTRNHARELARALIPVSDKDPLWGNAAGMVFIACICKLQAERRQGWGWGDLLDLIMLPVSELKPIAEAYYPPASQAVADAESKTTQSIVINLTAFMQDVYEMALAWRDTRDKFSFCDWWQGGRGPQVVILQGSGEFASLAGGYISAIIRMIASLTASPSFPDSKDRKNLIVIDELAQLPKLERLEKFMEIGRSKGCPIVLATQSPAQLRKIYGEDDLAAWMAMAGSRLYVRTSGAADLAFVGREIGERKVYVPSQSRTISASGTAISDSFQMETQPVVQADYLSGWLGPTPKLRIRFLAQLAANPVELEIPILVDLKPLRPVFVPNPNFNAPLESVAAQAIPLAAEYYCGTAGSSPQPPSPSCSAANAAAEQPARPGESASVSPSPPPAAAGQGGVDDAEMLEMLGLTPPTDPPENVAAEGSPEDGRSYCSTPEPALPAATMTQQQPTDDELAAIFGGPQETADTPETVPVQAIPDTAESYCCSPPVSSPEAPEALDDVLDFLAGTSAPRSAKGDGTQTAQ